MLNTIDQEMLRLFSVDEKELFSSFTSDSFGNKIGFVKLFDGSTYLLRKNKNQNLRAVRYLEDGTKIIFIKGSETSLAAKHVFAKDNSEVVFKYDEDFCITEIISFNADASIFRTSSDKHGEIVEIYDEINQNGKTFTIKKNRAVAFINIDKHGKVFKKGPKELLNYLKTKFEKELESV